MLAASEAKGKYRDDGLVHIQPEIVYSAGFPAHLLAATTGLNPAKAAVRLVVAERGCGIVPPPSFGDRGEDDEQLGRGVGFSLLLLSSIAR